MKRIQKSVICIIMALSFFTGFLLVLNLSTYMNKSSEISKLTFKNENYNNFIITKVIGTVTNNNKNATKFSIVTTYKDKDGSLLITKGIDTKLVVPGETKHFEYFIVNEDISNTTYKTKLEPINAKK